MASVITIDGPGGSGKGTLARMVAFDLDFHLLDSGAIYRILALAALERGIEFHDVTALCALSNVIDLTFPYTRQSTEIRLGDIDVSATIRTQSVADGASKVALNPLVRDALINLQRRYLKKNYLN